MAIYRKDLKPVFAKWQPVGRLLALLCLPLTPVLWAGVVLWQERRDLISALRENVEVVFREWK